jgi:hypothetical protein
VYLSAGKEQRNSHGKATRNGNGKSPLNSISATTCCLSCGCGICNPASPTPIRARLTISGASGCCAVVNGAWDADWSLVGPDIRTCVSANISTSAASCCLNGFTAIPLIIRFGSSNNTTDPFTASVICPRPTGNIFVYSGTMFGGNVVQDFCNFQTSSTFAMVKQTADAAFAACPATINFNMLRLA